MSKPEKRMGFAQGLYEISSTKKERIGTRRTDLFGCVYRYAKAGAAALTPGLLGFATQTNAGWRYKACTAASAGDRQMTLTVTAGGTLDADELDGGLFIVMYGATTNAHATKYRIESNTALAAAGTSITITLESPLVTALTTSDYFSLQVSPWAKVVESATEENVPSGIPMVAVTAAYYYWCQTKGICAGSIKARKTMATMTLDPGLALIPSLSAGYLCPLNDTWDPQYPIVGHFMGVQNTLSAYTRMAFPIMLEIER